MLDWAAPIVAIVVLIQGPKDRAEFSSTTDQQDGPRFPTFPWIWGTSPAPRLFIVSARAASGVTCCSCQEQLHKISLGSASPQPLLPNQPLSSRSCFLGRCKYRDPFLPKRSTGDTGHFISKQTSWIFFFLFSPAAPQVVVIIIIINHKQS